MSGWVAGVGAGGALLSGALTLNGQQQQAGNAASAMQMAQQNYLLQKRMADNQIEMSQAGQQDARGNYTHYVPGRGWVTDVTPTTRGLITSSDANTRENNVQSLTRGGMERSQNFSRRQEEGGIANSLLAQIKNGYGAPTREGVQGAHRLAGVTGANENADIMKSAVSSNALRSGTSMLPVSNNFANINRGAVTGTRSAIARADEEAPGMFTAQMQNYTKGLSDPYNMFAARAGNSGDVPFSPENVSAGVDASRQGSAAYGQSTVGRGAAGLNTGTGGILEANKQNFLMQPNYGMFAGGATDILTSLLKKYQGKSDTIVNANSGGGGWQSGYGQDYIP